MCPQEPSSFTTHTFPTRPQPYAYAKVYSLCTFSFSPSGRQAARKDDQPTEKPGLGREARSGPTTVLRLKRVAAKSAIAVRGEDELSWKSKYFIGNDPKKWRTNVPNYGRVRYEGVCRGVDVIY